MKKIWTKAAKKRVDDWFEYWIVILGIAPVHISTEFLEKGDDDKAMTVHQRFPYRQINVTVYPQVAKMGKREIAHATCHELMHYVLAPITKHRKSPENIFIDMEEVVVDQLAMCFEDILYNK